MKTQIYNLASIKDAVKASSEVRSISENLNSNKNLIQPFLETCLIHVLPYFKETFSIDTKIQCIDFWLLQPTHVALSTLVSCLKNKQGCFIAALYLKRWTNECIFAKTIDEFRNSGNKEQYNVLLSIIFSIPDRIANVFLNEEEGGEKKHLPKKYKPEYFFRKLALSLSKVDSSLLSKFALLNLCKYVWMTSFNAPQIAEAVIDLQPSAVSPFILSLIEESPAEFASAVLSVLYSSVERARKLVNEHFLTQKVLSERAQDILINFMIGQGEVVSTLERCGEIWSRHTLITQMSTGLHAQLSRIILKLLMRTNKEELNSCKATSLIMSGVTVHIGITSPEIRKLGLQIGEMITGILLPEQAVKFDELHPENKKDENEDVLTKPVTVPEKDTDSDAELDIESEWNEGMEKIQEDDDEEPLIPYAIHDEVGIDGPPIMHPRELIKLFRTDENDTERFRKFQSAISVAADVVKRTTELELDQMGNELLSVLLSIDNEYNQDDFEDNRRKALIALMVTFPVNASKMVVGELRKGREYSLGRRLILITAIAYAASDLTELPKPEREDIIEGHIQRWGDPKNARRWGSALHKIKEVKANNRFSPCATMYFYGLLSSIDLQKILREEDGLEATQTLTTLAVIIEAAGESVMELKRMATDLFDVATVLSPIRPPNARKALLFAISCAVRVLKNYRGNDTMGEFLVNIAENDPDESVRNIAIGTCSILAQRHDDDMDNLFKSV